MRMSVLVWIVASLGSCALETDTTPPVLPEVSFYRAVDASFLPVIEKSGFGYTMNGVKEDPLKTLKNGGCNAIRLRLWHSPSGSSSGWADVAAFARRIHESGLRVWLTVHYSDTWADPGNQTKPAAWKELDFPSLQNAVTDYTAKIIHEIQPDIIQIGNETNDGMLWPEGRLSVNQHQYLQLLKQACSTVRAHSMETKIMLHFAGLTGAEWYFSKVSEIDYDYIGISYYPLWHGKNLGQVTSALQALGQKTQKKILIAETAYPFTLGWNDWTNNIVGLPDQLIPGMEATKEGQKNFLLAIKALIKEVPQGMGFCYWGAEWVAFRGKEATNGSSWENQALWDFDNNAVPALEAFLPD